MTFKYENVYLLNTATVVGPYEKEGPLYNFFDKKHNDLYNNEKTWEKAEVSFLKESIDLLLKKENINKVDLAISGDLLNQICSSTYALEKYKIPFLGIYSACSTITEGLIIGSSLIDSKKINNCLICTSSHNLSSEKQFRNPTEYGSPKPKTSTFTSTGGASCILTNKKTDIKIESSTIGKIIDLNQNDIYNMGAVMAPAAADTIYRHLKDLNRESSYYDLILTGDLGLYGKKILIDYMKKKYDIDLSVNYNDSGIMLYNIKKQKKINAGGSGPVCIALVLFGYIYKLMREKQLKRVLICATGALFSPTFVYQKNNINSICHAVSLEVV